jgi:hypothetical protein
MLLGGIANAQKQNLFLERKKFFRIESQSSTFLLLFHLPKRCLAFSKSF